MRQHLRDRVPPPVCCQYASPPRGDSLTHGRDYIFEVDPSSQQRLPTCDTAIAPSGYSTLSPNVPPDHGDDVLSVTKSAGHIAQNDQPLAEQGPCLAPGIVSMDHSTFTAKIKILSGLTSAQFGCVALLDTGSPQSFITRNAWEHMVRSGAATTTCETQTPPRSWGGFGGSPPLQTPTAVRLSVQFLHNDQPTASPAVWTYIIPSEAMQHAVLLGRGSWMGFNERSYRTLPPRPSDNRVLVNLTLSHQHSSGAVAFASVFSDPTGGYHLLYAGDQGISLTRVPVSLVRSNGAPALAGSYLVDMLHGATDFSVDENLVESGLQQIPLVGTAELEPGDLLGTSPCPLLRVPV